MKQVNCILFFLLFITHNAFCGTIVMTVSDYETGNTAAYDIESNTFTDNILPLFQDAYAKTDGLNLYILEGMGADAVSKYDQSSISAGSEIYQYSTGINSNPLDIVFFNSKAYVLLNMSSTIWVVDPNAANEASFKQGEIDISQWADGDGYPDACMGFVYNDMIYVILQRYDYKSFTAGIPVLVEIDPLTDTIVDMDPSTDGVQGVELIVKNPSAGSLVGSTLYLGGTTYGVSEEGVMRVNLDDPKNSQEKIFNETDAGGNITGVRVLSDDYGIVFTYDENWNKISRTFNPQDSTLGDLLPVPSAGGRDCSVALVEGKLYVGSSDFSNPGMYIVDVATNTVLDMFPTELPPYSLVYVDGTTTFVAENKKVPAEFVIEPAYPNPFNPSTTISFKVNNPETIRVDVYNTAGQKVDTLINSFMTSGYHSIIWNAAPLSSGLYYVTVSNGIITRTVKATLMK